MKQLYSTQAGWQVVVRNLDILMPAAVNKQ
jgi:hypothetical protein